MKKFKYVAVNLNGKKFKGSFLAENEDDLRAQLVKQGLYLVKSSVSSDKAPNAFFSVTGKVAVGEIATFCRQFSIMLTSGMSIIDSLDILRSQSFTAFFRKILIQVHEDVKSGKLLSEAFSKHKKALYQFFISMLRIGELSGSLETVLVNVADYFEADGKLRSRVKAALTYPVLLIFMAIAIVILMIVFIIPTFQKALFELDVELPAITLFLINFGQFFRENWKIILLVIVAVFLVFFAVIHTRPGRLVWDRLKFRVFPGKRVVKNNLTARFCRAFALLIESGMDIADAMDEVVIVLGNKYVEQEFQKAAEDVRRGMSLTLALENYKLFPEMMVQMISVGERTNEIASVLGRSCGYFETEVDRAVNSLVAIVQPAALAIIGATIGVLFYAVYAPMLSLMTQL